MSTLLFTLFLNASIQYTLPPQLLESVCFVETKWDVKAVHPHDGKGDSLGICQVKLATAQMLGFKGTAAQLMVPSTNIRYAAKYLRHQLNRYNGDVTKAIIAYNRGNARGLTSTQYSDKVNERLTEVTREVASEVQTRR